MDLFLVVKGNEQFYCPPEQKDYWAQQGYAVFELKPTQVAGPVQETTYDTEEPVRTETETPIGEIVSAQSKEA